MTECLIMLNKIIKLYDHPDNRHGIIALRDISLEISHGELVVIQGVSGAGKSTLLKVISGRLRPTAGQIILDGIDITNLNDLELKNMRRTKIGFIDQLPRRLLLDELTVLGNIKFQSELQRPKFDLSRAEEILNALDMDDKRHHYPSQLSGGEAQRVAIAIALQVAPQVIIADEPTAHVDNATAKTIINYLLKINELYNNTIIVATHDTLFGEVADEVFTLNDGKLTEVN